MSQRTERIDELLRQEIGKALESELSDPRIGFVTVTNVETSSDLSHAKVWVSVIGSEDERKETLSALRRAMPYVRHGLSSKIRMRRIPELDVRLDDSIDRGTRILHLLDEIQAGRSPEEIGAQPESLPTPVQRLPRDGDVPERESAVLPPQEPRKRFRRRPETGNSSKPGSKPGRGEGRRGPR